MKYAVTILAILGLAAVAVGQEQDSVAGPWTHGLVTGLTATQISFTDWAQGGQNAFSWTASLDGKHNWEQKPIEWRNSYKLAYGQAEIGGQGTRKTDDKIELESIVEYEMGNHIDPYFAVTFKSQFAKGYVYKATGDSLVSDIFDPAYITQSAGIGYKFIPEVRTRFGAALREVITSKYTHYADDPKTATVEKTRVEGGLESVTDVEWKIEENVLFTSKLELFSAFNALDKIILRSDNTLAAKFNKFLSVNLNVQFINDHVVSPRTQIKQTIAFGFSYVLI